MNTIIAWDYTVLKWISENLVHDSITFFMKFITFLGDSGMIWIIIALLCLLRPSTRRCGWSMIGALILSLVIGNLTIKPLVARLRPFQQYPDLTSLIPPPGEYSFPSGHSSSSFAAAMACFTNHKKAGIPALILAALIAFSRLYVCVHFPTDVLAGSLLGALLGAFSSRITAFLCKHYQKD